MFNILGSYCHKDENHCMYEYLVCIFIREYDYYDNGIYIRMHVYSVGAFDKYALERAYLFPCPDQSLSLLMPVM